MSRLNPYHADEDLPGVPLQMCEVPAEVESRLRNRFAAFRGRVVARPSAGWRETWLPAAHPLRWATVLAGAAAAAILLLGWLGTRSDAWAQVAKQLESVSWIHGKGQFAGGPGEFWISVPRGVWAIDFGKAGYVAYASRASRTNESYRSADRRLTRFPLAPRDEEALRQVDLLFNRAFRGAEGADLSTSTERLVKQSTSEVEVDGKRWLDFELTFRRVDGDRQRVLTYRVDPTTRLPHSCIEKPHFPDDPATRIDFDYPQTGPADIFALGVPRDAAVEDLVPTPDLEQILAGMRAGREKMDAYSGLIVQGSTSSHWSQASVVWRIWRSGNRWRVEQSGGKVPGRMPRTKAGDHPPRPADDVDHQAWWKKAAETIDFHPVVVSDGKTSYRFEVKATPEQIATYEDLERLRYEIVSVAPDYISTPTADGGPTIILLPEYVARPPLGIPSAGRQATFDPAPATGPTGTVLVSIVDKNAPSQGLRVWVDRNRGYMAARQEMESALNGKGVPQFQVQVIDEAAQSPGGTWYPLVMRSLAASDEIGKGIGDQPGGVTHYYLDFTTPIPPEVFATPELKQAPDRQESVPMPQTRVQAVQEARRSWSMSQLITIARAMNSYEQEHHHFPSATLIGPDGKTPHSWRVALLPYLGQKELFDRYHLEEPWDSADNLKVLEQMPEVYRAAQADKTTSAAYFLLTGEGTVFPPGKTLRMRDLVEHDGATDTLLVVEAKREIPWTRPEDIGYAADQPLPALGGFDPAGFSIVFADGSAFFIDKGRTDDATIRAWITPAGKEDVKRPDR